MILYLLNVALIICTSLVFYKVLLRNETFFRLNRFMLLACLVLAFMLPLVHVPPQWSFRKAGTEITASYLLPATKSDGQKVISAVPPANVSVQKAAGFFRDISFAELLAWVYWIGVAIFAVNFMIQLLTLIYRAYSRPVIQDGRFRIVELSGDQAPCSFGNNIFINPEKYEWETYSQIILHEKIHIQQGHSYDIILAELALVFQWFNPFAWLYRKAVEDNLEFLTDNDLLEHKEVDRSSYQLSLVKVSAPHFPVSLTTNYNQSILKKRLIMMNAKKSNLNTTWKYLFIAPLLMVFVCFLNEPRAYGTESKTLADKKLAALESFDNEGTWFATIKNDKVNIRFERDNEGKGSSSTTFHLSEFKDLPRDKDGNFELTREAGTILFNGKFTGNMGMGTYKFNADKAFTSYLKKEGIDVNEEKDAIVFFAINLKKSYVEMLKGQGYTSIKKDNLIPLAALDIDEKFIRSVKSNGFPNVSMDDLIPLKALGVDQEYIKEIRKSGYKDLTVSQLITFKSQNISGDFIKSSRDASPQNSISVSAVADAKSKGAKAKPSAAHKEDQEDEGTPSGLPSIDNLIAIKAMNITSDYTKGFKQLGYKVSDDDLIAMKSLGVTPEFVKSFKDAGMGNIAIDDAIAFKSLGITAADITAFKKLGYTNITADEMTAAKAMGVTPAYISSMKQKGHNLSSIDKYVEAKAITGQ